MNRNLFATVLTYAAPSSNYRGESEENRTVMQKITKGGKEYPIISPESIRNALREMLSKANPDWCNRSRLHDEGQPAVEYKELPNPQTYADDFLFGYLVAKDEYAKKMKDKGIPAKRDSVFRMNLALALTSYRFKAVFHQSPHNGGKSPWKNDSKSNLLHREVEYTAYQYPFALSQRDCQAKPEWTKALLKAIGELNEVAGGHARSYYEMAPASIVARLTSSLVAGFDTYGFDDKGGFADLVGERSRINSSDLPGEEFWIGGDIVRRMDEAERKRLAGAGVKLYDNPQRLIADLAEALLK